jgi:membrane protein
MATEPTVNKDDEVVAESVTPRPLPFKIRQLHWSTWRGVLWRSIVGYIDDDCTDFAAAMTYSTVTALIPSLVVIVALVNLVADGQAAVRSVLGLLRHLGIGSIVGNSSLTAVLDSLLNNENSAKVLLSFGLVITVWLASGYVSTFTRASNRIYGVREGRAWWKLQLLEMALAAVALVLLAVAATGLVISGPLVDAVGDALGAGETTRTVYSIGRWPVLVAIAIVLLSLLFWIAPNVKQPRFRWLTLGGAVALSVWALVSFFFGLYVTNFGSYDRTYGSLGAIMAFLVWLYLSNTAVLLGVEVNAQVQRGRLIQAGDHDPKAPLARKDGLTEGDSGNPLDMDRGSNKHSPRVDDQMAAEVRGTVQGIAGGRAEEWKMAEPSGEDQPQVSVVPEAENVRGEPGGVGSPQGEAFSRFGSYIGLSALPGDRAALLKSAQDLEAPDDVVARLESLPADTTYRNVAEAWWASEAG